MILADEQLESIAQALAHEKALTWIVSISNGNRLVRMFGADVWHQWELNKAALLEVIDRVLELWTD